MNFIQFITEKYNKLKKYSLPIIDCGIEKNRKISEGFIPHNKAKKIGLLGTNFNDNNENENENEKDIKNISRYKKYSDELHKQMEHNEYKQEEETPLEPHELDSLYKYTDDSSQINRHLFNKHIYKSDPPHNSETENHIKNLDSILKKRNLNGGILYTGLGSKIHSNIGEMLKRGIVHSPSYLSTSHNINKAAGFSTVDKDDTRHILEIHVPNGHSGIYTTRYSSYPEEKETLLPRGLSFKVHPRPRIYTKNNETYHIWKAHPIDKEEAEKIHNKNINKMLENQDAIGLKNYYTHESNEDDKKQMRAMIESDYKKQLEYYGDRRNHGLLVNNPNLRSDLREALENSNSPGIMRHFARNSDKLKLHKKFLKKGLYDDLIRNEHINGDIAKDVVENANINNFDHMIKSLTYGKAIKDHDRKLKEILPIMIKRGNYSTHLKLSKKRFETENLTPYKDHILHLINLNNKKLNNEMVKNIDVKDLNDEYKDKLYNHIDNNLKHHILYKASKEYKINKIRNGTDEDKLAVIKNMIHSGDETHSNELTNEISKTDNISVLRELAKNYWMLGNEAHDKVKPMFDKNIDNHINDISKHKLLIHNPNLDKNYIVAIINKNPGISNDVIEKMHDNDLPTLSYGHIINHIVNNHSNKITPRNYNKLHDLILNHGTVHTMDNASYDHIINNSDDEEKKKKALKLKDHKNKLYPDNI